MTMMDDKIERDLAELYNGGRMHGKFCYNEYIR